MQTKEVRKGKRTEKKVRKEAGLKNKKSTIRGEEERK